MPYFDLCMYAHSLSCVLLFGAIWTRAHQAALSMGFFRQEYWSGLIFPPSDDFMLSFPKLNYFLSHSYLGRAPLEATV